MPDRGTLIGGPKGDGKVEGSIDVFKRRVALMTVAIPPAPYRRAPRVPRIKSDSVAATLGKHDVHLRQLAWVPSPVTRQQQQTSLLDESSSAQRKQSMSSRRNHL